MSLEGLLYDEGFSRLYFEGEDDIFALEVYVCESRTDVPVPHKLSYSHLGDWLHQRGDFKKDERTTRTDFKGGLRLLFQPWCFSANSPAPVQKTKIVDDKNCKCLPLKSQSTLKAIIDVLKLPRCYPHDIVHRHHVPVRLSRIWNGATDNIGIVCQSPDFNESFMSMALSYNPTTRITSGFCGYTTQNAENASLIKMLKQGRFSAHHPMLLPALAYGIFWDRLRGQTKDVRLAMKEVQAETGLLKDYLKLPNIVRRGNRKDPGYQDTEDVQPDQFDHRDKGRIDFDYLHKRIIEQQARMTNGLADFVSDVGPACHQALSSISEESFDTKDDDEGSLEDNELQTYVQYLNCAAKIELEYRDQQLSRVEVQLKVLYNLMQQRIAQEAGSDSSAMKSIALLTMLFLPSTALATIFSMGSFFSMAPGGSGLQVSDKFWIFWAFSIPITIVVVATFTLWIQRREIRHFFEARMQPWGRGKSRNGKPDIERGWLGNTLVSGKTC